MATPHVAALRRLQLRNWCLTLNNPTSGQLASWEIFADDGDPSISYFVFQTERGSPVPPATLGTLHLQGYVEFKLATRLTKVKRYFGRGVHAERRRGTGLEASTYCKKDDSRVEGSSGEWGHLKAPRGRPKGGFAKAVVAIKAGTSAADILEEFPEVVAMFPDKLNCFRIGLMGHRDWAMDIEIFFGPTGTGKSSTAKTENPGAYSAPWPRGGRWWWPMYGGEPVVILDEFRHQVKMDDFLRLFDRHAMILEAKGTNFHFVSRKLVITTNIDPKDWYKGLSLETLAPLQRRIREFAKIYDFAEGFTYPNFSKALRTEVFSFNPRGDSSGYLGGQ